MTEVNQQPDDQEDAQTPERVVDTPEGREVKVRGYDALDTEIVTRDIATNTRGAITRVNVGKEGPKPIPGTVNATTPNNSDAQRRAKERLEKIYRLLDPGLQEDIDILLTKKTQEYPHDMSAAIRSFLQSANFGFKFSELGVGQTEYGEATEYNNTPQQIERSQMRGNFIQALVAHGQQTIKDHIKRRLENYSHLLLEAQKTLGGGETRRFHSGRHYYTTLTAIAELTPSTQNGEVRYFYKKSFVNLAAGL